MSFIIKENIVYVHCKLTDEGRRKISEGKFNPTMFSIGDSEVNYEYYRDNNHNIEDSFVNSPIDRYNKIKYTIKSTKDDTIDKYNLILNSPTERTYLRDVEDIGFYNGSKYNFTLKTDNLFVKSKNFKIDLSNLDKNNNFNLKIIKTNNYDSSTKEPESGDYVVIKWNNPYTISDNFVDGEIDANQINPYIWYKIKDKTGTLSNNTIELTVDRELPNFGTGLTENTLFSYGYIYPSYNSMEYFYNSPYVSDYWDSRVLNFENTDNNPPIDSQIWNMNILHIDDIIGINNININKDKQLSNPYAGLTTYLSELDDIYTNIGIIHYTNNNPSNKYGDKFEENIEINLPTILWHKNEDNKTGLYLKSDNIKKYTSSHDLEYYNLVDDWGNVLGKIFNDLKLIIITDQELLFALSYKSNRNWTMVEPLINFNLNTCEVDTSGNGTVLYGTFEVLGSLVEIPVPDDIDIFDGNSVDNINLTGFSLDIPFGSNDNDFIWLAIPSIFPIRTKWYVNIFNRGDIGGIKNINGNLFPDPETTIVNGIEYTIYISNYRTKAETINFLL